MSNLLKSLQDKVRALIGESDTITTKDAPSAEEQTRLAEIVTELAGLRPQVEAAKAAFDAAQWARQPMPMVPLVGDGGAADTGGDQGADRAMVKMWFAKRYGEVPSAAEQIAKELYGSVGNGDYAQLAWDKNRSFNHYLRTGEEGDRTLARLILLSPSQIVEAAAKAVSLREIKTVMIEGDDTLGGYLVPEDFRAELIERLPGQTVVRRYATVETTSRDRVTRPKRTGGGTRYIGAVRVTWTDETPAAGDTTTNATFGQVSIPVNTVMADTEVSKNELEDAVFDVASFLLPEFSSAMAIDEDEQFLVGATAGAPQGILNGTAANGAPFDGDITTVNSGVAAALAGDGVKAVPFAIAKQYRQNKSIWVMAKASLQAVAQLKDGQGRYLIGVNEQLAAQAIPDALLGYTVEESEAMPAIAANTYPIIFGDLKGYNIADRIGMSVQRYDDSATARRNSVIFVVRRRLGGQVTQGWRLAVQKVSV